MANFDLANVSDNSPLVKKFSQAIAKATGQIVVGFVAQKMKRVANESTKDLDFNLENGQSITLVVRTNGDVVRVKLNGKDTPLKTDLFHFSADSFTAIGPVTGAKYNLGANEADQKSPAAVFAKAVAEIGERVRQTQPAFDKRRAQQKIIPVKQSTGGGGGGSSRSASTSARELRVNLADLDKQIVEKSAIRDELKLKVQSRNIQINQASKAPINTAVFEANPGVIS